MLNFKIVVKKTFELKDQELHNYTNTFNSIFKKELPLSHFLSKYKSAHNNYSIHSLAFSEENHICGGFTVIPYLYKVGNENILIGLGCDAFISEKFRKNELLLLKLYKSMESTLSNENIESIISIPNPKATKYWKILAKWKDIGELELKIFPLNLFGLRKIWFFIFKVLFSFNIESEKSDYIRLDRNDFFLKKRFEGYYSYKNIYYKVSDEGKYKILYVFGLNQISKKDRFLFFNYIFKNKNADLICIVSNFKIVPFFKIPKNKLDRTFSVLISKLTKKIDLPFSKWSLDLENFDNR